jgi:hypothetical protein
MEPRKRPNLDAVRDMLSEEDDRVREEPSADETAENESADNDTDDSGRDDEAGS